MKIFNFIALVAVIIFSGCGNQPLPPKDNFVVIGGAKHQVVDEVDDTFLDKKKRLYEVMKKSMQKSNIVLIYDASASMKAKLKSGKARYEVSYDGLVKIANIFNENDNISLMVFGSQIVSGVGKVIRDKDILNPYNSHRDVKLVYNEVKFNRENFLNSIKFLQKESSYVGDTPIGFALSRAIEILKDKPNSKIVLITDGEESTKVVNSLIFQNERYKKDLAYLKNMGEVKEWDSVMVEAKDVVKNLNGIYFIPILYGLKDTTTLISKAEIENIREFYKKLAKTNHTTYLEASSANELVVAFIDAEFMSIEYDLFKAKFLSKGAKFLTSRVGVPVKVPDGDYILNLKTTPNLEQKVEVSGANNIFILSFENDKFNLNKRN